LLPAGNADNIDKSWLIYDPLRHRYFKIMSDTFHLLSIWQPGIDSRRLLEKAKMTGLDIDQSGLKGVLECLKTNQL